MKKFRFVFFYVVAFMLLVFYGKTIHYHEVDSLKKIDNYNASYEASKQASKKEDSLQHILDKENDARWFKSKAGRINKKHPEWSKIDCINVSSGTVWIGMTYDMIIYQRGLPNQVNTSNYGNGEQYQCYWEDWKPSCIYMKQDNIITSYN
jgi:hypothetical protein